MTVYDETPCQLGEGPLWHPRRQQLFWCDIGGRQLLTRSEGKPKSWEFDRHVSALGWVDDAKIVITTETSFHLFDIETGSGQDIAALEADNPITRANDGRVDPFGGFWIGTMGKNAEKEAGAIYRWFKGDLRTLYPNITIPNSICFAPDGTTAYWTDSTKGLIMKQRLAEKDGWPIGDPEILIDLSGQPWVPDGSVVDADGNIWNAQWDGWRVACYAADGTFKTEVRLPAAHTTCPAFGGPELSTMFCTSALEGLTKDQRSKSHDHGKTFAVEGIAKGQPEHQLILG